MNTKQVSILNKEFKIKGANHHSITRCEFEGLPDPMIDWNWGVAKMQELADRISEQFGYDECPTVEIEQAEL